MLFRGPIRYKNQCSKWNFITRPNIQEYSSYRDTIRAFRNIYYCVKRVFYSTVVKLAADASNSSSNSPQNLSRWVRVWEINITPTPLKIDFKIRFEFSTSTLLDKLCCFFHFCWFTNNDKRDTSLLRYWEQKF